ncbi:hypothetical protein [Nitrosomonas aestuarii]|uniref:hypothetical protein n=1 Tax=Nitrosomonas aestuarii TaxID=52441 RepID=UPI000D2F8D4C|nr:hypothetical protein [Nitrosomonas aestuarii]PTN11142.1 lysophospholipase-like protein [Nitrosomonas aestuarii]
MSSPVKYKVGLYSQNAWNEPNKKTKTGLCLSGGGSRALSAGLGQLIGLKSLSNNNGGTVLDSINYISSVSGGTWLTSIFSFSINQNFDDLLGVYAPPDTLTESNIGDLPAGSIGHAPGNLSYTGMLDALHHNIGLENIYNHPEVRKWAWPVIVGELILKPYGLYNGTMEGSKQNITPMPKRFFSLDQTYMENNIKTLTGDGVAIGSLTGDDFYFHQSGRPFPIMNTNIKFNYQQDNSALLPVQGTPVAVGATGEITESGVSLTADGGVESFAFTSDWRSQTGDGAVVDISRRYSLIDLVACSSAFFANAVGKKIAASAAAFAAGTHHQTAAEKKDSIKQAETAILKNLASFVPQYNYWPAGPSSPNNQNTGFSDGGSLDNTGLQGMLARSDATRIIACYNAEIPLGGREDIAVSGYGKKVAAISTDIPILFGYQPKPVNGTYVLFSDKTPADLKFLEAAQVFESSAFGPLVSQLFAASNGQQSPAVTFTCSLKVCDNPYAGICKRGTVDVLWIYNNYADTWVKKINSWMLADNIRYGRYDPLSDFYNFPNYDTALQIDLNSTQVNALAQYQAWIINQLSEQIKQLFGL